MTADPRHKEDFGNRKKVAAYPSRFGGGFSTLLHLILLAAVCLPPLLVEIDRRNPKHWMEGVSLLTSQETWLNQRDSDGQAWLNPTINGGLRLNKPPMLIWLNMLAWTGIDPEASTAEQIMGRARLVTIGLGLVLVGSIYWMGRTLDPRTGDPRTGDPRQGGARLGLSSGLIACTTPLFFQMQARMASYDMHLVAWAALASAAAMWAMQPFVETRSLRRAVLGWMICGVAAGLSVMSKNPLGLLVCGLLIGIISVMDWGHIRGRLLGLLIAAFFCSIVVAPWYCYQYIRDPQTAMALWGNEFSGRDSSRHGQFFYVILLRLALPWTLWVIGGLFHPFMSSVGAERRRRLIPWLWFVSILVIFSLHGGKAARYILPILPAMALIAAQVFNDHQRLADRGEADSGAKLLYLPHWLLLMGASVVLVPLMAAQPWLIERGRLDELVISPVGAMKAAFVTAVLLSLAVVGFVWHSRNRPMRGVVLTSLWTVVLSVVYWQSYANTPNEMDRFRAQAERVATIIGDAPMFCVSESLAQHPDLEFLFFIRRTVPMVSPQGIEDYAMGLAGPAFAMADRGGGFDDPLRAAGFEIVIDFEDEAGHERSLWWR